MAEWDTAYINDLPDSAFLVVSSGGHKDRDGKTVPRTLRHFPVYNAAGSLDRPHLQNALGRIPQATTISRAQRESAHAKAQRLWDSMTASSRSRDPEEEPLPARIEVRAYELSDLDVRDTGEGRTIIGRAVPYGRVAELPRGGRERVVFGAFSRQVASNQAHRVNMYQSHRRRLAGDFPIGGTRSLEERADGLWGVWPLIRSAQADEALAVLEARLVTGLSIGFSSPEGGTVRTRDGIEEVRRAHLDHVCLTDVPVYEDAEVMAIRDQVEHRPDPLEHWRSDKASLDRIMGAR